MRVCLGRVGFPGRALALDILTEEHTVTSRSLLEKPPTSNIGGTWHMYSVVSDELDVDYIVGWRIDGRMPENIEVVSPDT